MAEGPMTPTEARPPSTPTGASRPSTPTEARSPREAPSTPRAPLVPESPRTPRLPQGGAINNAVLADGETSPMALVVGQPQTIKKETSFSRISNTSTSAAKLEGDRPQGYLANRRTLSSLSAKDKKVSRPGQPEPKAEEEDQPWRDSHRRQANQFRAKALHYMQLEHLANREEKSTHRGILRQVVTKQHKHKSGCLELPLNVFFFILYAMAARLHEDITNVWFLESAMRHTLGNSMKSVSTIDDVWAWLKTDMLSELFMQKDLFGEDLPPTEWSRVLLYSQVEGAVVLTQARDNDKPWGVPHTGNFSTSPEDHLLAEFASENRGFKSRAAVTAEDRSRRLESDRRLNTLGAMWMKSHLPGVSPDDQTYDAKLFPTQFQNVSKAKIEYLESRRWLDQHTNSLTITTLLLNGELGRPRLEQVTITLSFSRGGGIYHLVDLQALFLLPFPQGFEGFMSMGVDALWVFMLLGNSANCVWKLWVEFLESRAVAALSSGMLPLEFFIMGLGWLNVGGFVIQMQLGDKVAESLQFLWQAMAEHSDKSHLHSDEEEKSDRLHSDADDFISIMLQARTGISFLSLLLIFRFFFSFRMQPRLAVVTNTLVAVMNDLAHFVVVFAPTFFAYAISGHFLFGRRLEEWSTVEGSVGVCMRIAFENEFEWLELSEETFSIPALWAWSYLLFVVLIMINMVLAIVLDIYNEVRQSTDVGDTIMMFFEDMAKRLWHSKEFVKDNDVACLYGDGVDDTTTLCEQDFLEALPQMGPTQRNILMKACNRETSWQAKHDLATTNFLKLGASVKLSIDEAAEEILIADNEFHGDPSSSKCTGSTSFLSTTPPTNGAAHAAGQNGLIDPLTTPRRLAGVSQAFPGMPPTPGGYAPPMCPPTSTHTGVLLEAFPEVGNEPEWHRSLQEKMRSSSELMEDVQAAMQAIHLEWHHLDIAAQRKEMGPRPDMRSGTRMTMTAEEAVAGNIQQKTKVANNKPVL